MPGGTGAGTGGTEKGGGGAQWGEHGRLKQKNDFSSFLINFKIIFRKQIDLDLYLQNNFKHPLEIL